MTPIITGEMNRRISKRIIGRSPPSGSSAAVPNVDFATALQDKARDARPANAPKSGRGFFDWNDDSIAKERARYERALRKCLEIFREEGIV
jgi:hypothetical protein